MIDILQNYYPVMMLMVIIFFLGIILLRYYEPYAIKKDILAVPSSRTLHGNKTPRGGGIVFSLLFVFGIAILFVFGITSFEVLMVLGVGGFVATIFGFADDIVDISEGYKMTVQILLAMWVIYWFDANILIEWVPSWFSLFITAFLLVWMINLYNFMDGIDGMAISGALFISIVASILSLVGGGLELSIIFFLLAVSSVGFIIYNWPPARIFMGDAGSIFLGYCFGALVLKSSTNGDISFWIWVIILSYFVVDTTVTLLLRIVIVRRYLPHRSHAYQNLARIWNSHAKVTGLVMAYHFIWILPLSVWATIDNDVEIIAALLAIVPVILLTLKYGPIFSSS
jgi:Fuc2NAc and GlcNAc transferase